MKTKKLPASAFQFLAPAGISTPDDATASSERTLTGIAYSGGLVTDHGYWDALLIDLASLTVDSPIPLLCDHDQECSIGMVTSADASGGNLNIQARLFADIDDEAAEIAAKADKGFPWQLSVGIWPSSIENVPVGSSIELNGQAFPGPVNVFRGGRVREISVVAIGADPKTSATVLNAGDSFEIPFINHEADAMSEELKAKIAVLEAENAQLKTQTIELAAKSPDPAKFVPVEVLHATQAELSALRDKEAERSINDLIDPALADGRLLAAQEQWARDLGKSDFKALETFLATSRAPAALQGTQTGGKAPESSAKYGKFKAAQGCVVDAETSSLHAQIAEFAAANGVDFRTAAIQMGV